MDVSELAAHREQLRVSVAPVFACHPAVAAAYIFGSVARGQAGPDSDLDVLVTFDELPGLIRLIELEDHLSDLLGVKVDLVLRNSLKPWIGPTVLREVVPV